MSNPGPDDRGRVRDFGRDGVSGMVSHERGMRAREVSVPTTQDRVNAATVLDALLARADGRRHR